MPSDPSMASSKIVCPKRHQYDVIIVRNQGLSGIIKSRSLVSDRYESMIKRMKEACISFYGEKGQVACVEICTLCGLCFS